MNTLNNTKFQGYELDSMVLVKNNALRRIKFRKHPSKILGKTFRRNNLKLIKKARSNSFDIPCGETLEVRKLYYLRPVMNTIIYYTSRGFYIAPHRLRRYYVEV